MSFSDETRWCIGCGTEIRWPAFVVNEKEYCCQDCAHGMNCKCRADMEWDEDYREHMASISTIGVGQ